MWTGDMPAVSKLMCMLGHNAYLGCRFCYLKGTYSAKYKHVYYPCFIPRSNEEDVSDFDPEDLPNRTENNFLNDISKIMNETNNKARKSYIKETGIINFNLILIKFIELYFNYIIFFYFILNRN
jgi:hypothetical protein